MNAAIHKIGSDEITYFVRDCVKRGNNYVGSNKKLVGIKSQHWQVVWTEEDITGSDNNWSKKVSELNHSSQMVELTKGGPVEYSRAVGIMDFLSTKTYQQVEDYINLNITDLQAAKSYLVDLSKVVLALIKIVSEKD